MKRPVQEQDLMQLLRRVETAQDTNVDCSGLHKYDVFRLVGQDPSSRIRRLSALILCIYLGKVFIKPSQKNKQPITEDILCLNPDNLEME